jgi:hypothetical protein
MQVVGLRAIQGVPLLVLEGPEVCLADTGCLAVHTLVQEQGCVEIGAALIEFAVVRQVLHAVEDEEVLPERVGR